MREHVHLSYAATAYGVQGVTAPASHTILTDSLGGAAVYVGMTRGRETNTLHVVADDMAGARQQFIEALERDRADRGLADATERAAEAVRGLVNDGPVKLVNAETEALMKQTERAEQQAALWRRAADALTDWQDADAAHRAARDRLRTLGRFGKRRATTEHNTARALLQDAEQRLTRAWGELPRWNEDSASWVERVIRPRIDAENQAHAAKQARAEIETLRALTPVEAVSRIEQTHAAEQAAHEAAGRALEERSRQLRSHSRDSGPHHGGRSLSW